MINNNSNDINSRLWHLLHAFIVAFANLCVRVAVLVCHMGGWNQTKTFKRKRFPDHVYWNFVSGCFQIVRITASLLLISTKKGTHTKETKTHKKIVLCLPFFSLSLSRRMCYFHATKCVNECDHVDIFMHVCVVVCMHKRRHKHAQRSFRRCSFSLFLSLLFSYFSLVWWSFHFILL